MNALKAIFFTAIFIVISQSCYSQDWLKLDNGFSHQPAVVQYFNDVNQNELYVYGHLWTNSAGDTLNGVARWSGTIFEPLIPNSSFSNSQCTGLFKYHDTLFLSHPLFIDGEFYIPAFFDEENNTLSYSPNTLNDAFLTTKYIDDALYVTGGFTKCFGKDTWGFCKYENGEWQSVYSFPFGAGSIDDRILDFEYYKGRFYVGGNIYAIDPEDNPVSDVGYIENDRYHSFGGGFYSGVTGSVGALEVYKNELYIAGYFLEENGDAGNHIMRWDGQTLRDVGGGLDELANDMLVYNGYLYVCGAFNYAGGVYAPKIARWDGENWYPVTYDEFDGQVWDMTIFKDELYIAGNFKTINADSFNYVAKYAHQLPGEENQLEVWMNNYNEEIIINVEDSTIYTIQLHLYDLSGRRIQQYTLENYTGYFHQKISVAGLAAGVYIADVRAGKKRTIRKLLKTP